MKVHNNKKFPKWESNTLVGSLTGTNNAGQSIYRLNLIKNHPNLLERIELNDRVRYLTISEDGSIWFKTDSQFLGRLSLILN